jgi:serine/threonine-protein kinase
MSRTAPSLREIYEQALELPTPERAIFLDRVCVDADRRRAIERMLAPQDANPAHAGLLEREPAELAQRLSASEAMADSDRWLGREFAGFTLVALLGQGGAAFVYRGERDEGGVLQRVAVKIMRRLVVGRDELRQFRRERTALAQLTHPNIARYLDGGVTDDGVAYIVLELVEGVRITEFVRQRNLDMAARVRLMIAVCRSVEAAHRALIVHRDLKPANVLITADGHVKLLDFGIAKFLGAGHDATETQHRALTPAYAAPEQFTGMAITTATDVYALGVLLGEVVTGQRVSAEHTRAPSTLISDDSERGVLPGPPHVVRRQVRGDLDNVILKAAAAEPERRYASAEALAADLERFLAQQPVLAHPPSTWYAWRKFVQRNRLAVAVTTMASLGVLVSLALALIQGRAAREQALRAEATRDFLVDVFRSAEPAGPKAREITVNEVTEAAVLRARQDQNLPAEVRVDLLTELGAVLRGQGAFARSIEVLEQALAAAPIEPRETAARVRLELAQSLILAADHDRALRVLDEVAAEENLLPADMHVLRLIRQADVFGKTLRETQALAAARAAVEACMRGCAQDLRVEALEMLGYTAGTFTRNEEALHALERALDEARAYFGPVHVRVAAILNGISGAQRRLGRLEDAMRSAEEVARIDAVVLPPMHWRRSTHLNYLGMLQYAKGEWRAALATWEQQLAIDREVWGVDSNELEGVLNNLGYVRMLLGDYTRAVADINEALVRTEQTDGADSARAAIRRCSLGVSVALAGRLDEGIEHCTRAVAVLDAAGLSQRAELTNALQKLGQLCLWRGDTQLALTHFERALSVGATLGKEWPERQRWVARIGHAEAELALGRAETADQELREALRTLAGDNAAAALLLSAQLALTEHALMRGDADAARQRLARARTQAQALPAVRPYDARRLESLTRRLVVTSR